MPKALTISYDRNDVDFEKVHDWLSNQAYWALGRSEETIRTSIANSLNISVFDEKHKFIGYGRVVSDGVTFGWLCDVFVDPSERRNGAGKAIAQAAVDHFEDLPDFRLILKTTDAQEIYRSAGFTEFTDPDKWMIVLSDS